ncbi:MAG: ester cyclase [Rhodospirillaceae bacterium]|nr:ester cyclase [Rhodospirillaceae bacterium]
MRFALLVAAVAFAAPAAAVEIHCQGNEKNLETYLKMDDVLFHQRDADRVLEFYAPEFISHNSDQGGSGATKRTAESMKPMWINSKKSQPDRKLRNDLILCAADLVVVRVTITATQTGPMFGLPATGKAYSTTATDIFRFKDGKVVERWGNNDGIGMLSQLGLLLPFAEALAKGVEKTP